MDRNVVIGFILIGLIILLTPMFTRWVSGRRTLEKQRLPSVQKTVKPSEERVGAEQEVVKEDVPLTSQESDDLEAEAPVWAPLEEFSPQSVVVENRTFRGEISTRGGVIKKWHLKEFRAGKGEGGDAESGPVQLVGKGGQGLALSWDNGREAMDLADAAFVPDRDSLIVLGDSPGTIGFVADLGKGKRIEKRLSIEPEGYMVDVSVRTWGLDVGDKIRIHWDGGLGDTEGDPMIDARYAMIRAYVGGDMSKHELGKKGKREELTSSIGGGWIGVRNKYFLVALIPDQRKGWEGVVFGRAEEETPEDFDFYLVSGDGGEEEIVSWAYLGPIQRRRLRELGVGLEHVMDPGWGAVGAIVGYIARGMLPLLLALYKVFPNYGVVIIVFSILVKIVVYPLTHKSYTASAEMQKLQPKLAALRERHKDDPQKLNRATMRLYKEHGVSPLGGCLPMLVQMPVFIALYRTLSGMIELRQAEFVWWLTDLSRPDPLKVLPILMGLTSFIQQKMMMKDPKQKAMVYIMPAFMTIIFLKFASGLVLYWTMFNVLSTAQQFMMERRKRASEAEE